MAAAATASATARMGLRWRGGIQAFCGFEQPLAGPLATAALAQASWGGAVAGAVGRQLVG